MAQATVFAPDSVSDVADEQFDRRQLDPLVANRFQEGFDLGGWSFDLKNELGPGIISPQFVSGTALQMLLQKVKKPPVFPFSLIMEERIFHKAVLVDERFFCHIDSSPVANSRSEYIIWSFLNGDKAGD